MSQIPLWYTGMTRIRTFDTSNNEQTSQPMLQALNWASIEALDQRLLKHPSRNSYDMDKVKVGSHDHVGLGHAEVIVLSYSMTF